MLNIMIKATPDTFDQGIEGVVVRPVKYNVTKIRYVIKFHKIINYYDCYR